MSASTRKSSNSNVVTITVVKRNKVVVSKTSKSLSTAHRTARELAFYYPSSTIEVHDEATETFKRFAVAKDGSYTYETFIGGEQVVFAA